jgi:hypothetical protein
MVFEGVARPGAALDDSLTSPATFDVVAYQKGSGPAIVEVETGTSAAGEGQVLSSVGIYPRAGERWQIFGDLQDGFVSTSACAGSRRLDGAEAAFVPTGGGITLPTIDSTAESATGVPAWAAAAGTAVGTATLAYGLVLLGRRVG